MTLGHVTTSHSGAGGKEASLFAAEIFQMYQKFSAYKQWKFEMLEADVGDSGGFKASCDCACS